MIINIDVDGVLRDFMSATIDVYKKYYDSKCNIEHNDITEYFFNRTLPLIKGDYHDFYKKYSKEIYVDALPYEKVLSDLLFLFKEHTINIVTKQPVGLEKYTLKWLERWPVPYHNIMFAQDKNLIRGDVLIDDYIGNLENYKQGIPVCMNQPWNQEWKGERINNLMEILNYEN